MKRSFLIVFFLINLKIILAQNLSIEEVKGFANRMLISNKYEIEVVKISDIRNNIRVALINLPYREFPDLLVFKYDSKESKWVRVFEGLCPGIQDNPSGLLDWHTIGTGIDFNINNDTIYDFNNKTVKIIISSMNKSNGILIPYQNFLHMHTADSISSKNFEPYVIDKTKYYDLAIRLFGERYKNYPNDQCMMFDSPSVTDFRFAFIDNLFQITANTSNGQIWIYSFRDIDKDNMYLIDKDIKAQNTR